MEKRNILRLVLLVALTVSSIVAAVPSAPSNTVVDGVTDTKIATGWTDNSGNEDGFKLYRFYKGLFGNPDGYEFIATVAANEDLYTFTGLNPTNGYTFAVSSYNGDGESEKIHMPYETTTHTWSGTMLTCALNSGGTINPVLGAISKQSLEGMDIFNCNDKGLTTMDPALQDLKNLNYLNLLDNNISGSIPTWIGGFSALKSINMQNNNLSGSIPVQVGNLSNLESLYLQFNQLTGGIPVEIENLTALKYLVLNNNYDLSGTIPSGIGKLTALEYLSLNDANLSGPIPAGTGDLEFLRILFIHNNELNGTIPSEFGNLTALTKLTLYNNHLSGEIPSDLKSLASLETVNLSINELSGAIPTGLGMLVNLELLDLSKNNLSGTIPSDITDLVLLTDSSGLELYSNCDLSSSDLTVQGFIDLKSSTYGGYQGILDSNHGNCQKSNIVPVIMYLLN